MDIGHGSDAKTDWKVLLISPGNRNLPGRKEHLAKERVGKEAPV